MSALPPSNARPQPCFSSPLSQGDCELSQAVESRAEPSLPGATGQTCSCSPLPSLGEGCAVSFVEGLAGGEKSLTNSGRRSPGGWGEGEMNEAGGGRGPPGAVPCSEEPEEFERRGCFRPRGRGGLCAPPHALFCAHIFVFAIVLG